MAIDETSRLLGEIDARLNGIDARLKKLDAGMDDMIALRNKGFVALAILSVVSAFIGAKSSAIISALIGLGK